MAKIDFLSSVRTAVSLSIPRFDADHPYMDRKELEGILRLSNLWLSPKAVAGYEHAELAGLDPGTRKNLDRHVATFLDVASGVDLNGSATPAQLDAAILPFLEIGLIASKYTLNEWLAASHSLIDQAAEWAKAKDWPTKRYPWTFTDWFIGTYELDRLIYGVMGSQMALVPIGRFTMSSRGSFDLAVMPAYESVMVRRGPSGLWMIDPLPGENRAHRWRSPAFVETSEKLSRMG